MKEEPTANIRIYPSSRMQLKIMAAKMGIALKRSITLAEIVRIILKGK